MVPLPEPRNRFERMTMLRSKRTTDIGKFAKLCKPTGQPVSKKLKVAFVQPIIPKYRSDFLRRFSEFTKLDILSLYGKLRSKKYKKICNYDKIHGFPHKALWAPLVVPRIQGQIYHVYFFPTLLWHLIKFRPQVVITEGEYMMLNNLLVFMYARIFGAKVVWWSLGKMVTRQKTIVNYLFDWLIRWEIFNCHFIVGKNTQACRYYHEKYGIPVDRTLVAPNSIDDINEKDIEQSKDDIAALRKRLGFGPVVLYVGAMTEAKRLEDLIRAMEDVWNKCPSAKLVLVGDGEVKSDLEKMVSELKWEDKVIFIGKVLEGVSKYFLLAEVFVLPGLGGLAIPHAMIHGVPVIAGIADGTEKDLIIDGVTGYLLKSDNNKELAEKIIAIITKPELRKEMSVNCKDFIETQWNIRLQVERMHMAAAKAREVRTTLGRCVKREAAN
ncbi:MAG: glycosyltransferase family 4 protein [Planctomycetes bacterium]|nr:glycosyltransferase family 4 protein [Planctomycetota bacterium]